MVNPMQAFATKQWVAFVCNAHDDALNLHQTFTVDEHANANLMAPRGNIIVAIDVPLLVAQDLLPTIHTDVTPPLDSGAFAPKDVRFVAASLRKLTEQRAFFNLHNDVSPSTRPKYFTHSGHGNVTIL